MGAYQSFASVYDALMADVDYAARTDYLCALFEKFDCLPTLMLDLACGTGSFSNEFSKKGIQVIGADLSEEMLCVAREKSAKQGNDILYLCQSAQNLDLYGTVDGAICCMDSLNHIIEYDELCAAFKKVSLFLEPGRLFIFDVNTPYKHEKILGNNTFVLAKEQIYCVWQNVFSKEENITDIVLDFFERQGGVYRRFREEFSERAYSKEETKSALEKAGLSVEAIYDDMSLSPASKQAERWIYVTRKTA